MKKIFNITTIQALRIINSLKKKGLIRVRILYKENSKEIQKRIIIPINIDVKDILNNNKIYDNKK